MMSYGCSEIEAFIGLSFYMLSFLCRFLYQNLKHHRDNLLLLLHDVVCAAVVAGTLLASPMTALIHFVAGNQATLGKEEATKLLAKLMTAALEEIGDFIFIL